MRNKSYLPAVASMFDIQPSKSQLQQIKIVEAAIHSFAQYGIEKTTYTNLAKNCGISRTLIHHYFPTFDSLFLVTAKYVRQTLLAFAQEGVNLNAYDERVKLDGYIDGCFQWPQKFPDQMKFWMLYYYQASLGGPALTANSELVRNGHLRIQAMIESGKEKHYFDFDDSVETSKTIQLLITGGLVSFATEDNGLTFKMGAELIKKQTKFLLKTKDFK